MSRAACSRGAVPDARRRRHARGRSARIRALDTFVRGGGILVALNRSATAAIDQLELPVRNVLAGVTRLQFFAGGSVMRVTTDPRSR